MKDLKGLKIMTDCAGRSYARGSFCYAEALAPRLLGFHWECSWRPSARQTNGGACRGLLCRNFATFSMRSMCDCADGPRKWLQANFPDVPLDSQAAPLSGVSLRLQADMSEPVHHLVGEVC